jgi:3-oxoacyl-[acyl-carrier protein] reductase
MDLGLSGKRVLVTGGSRGIGLAAARRFACEGAAVAIVGRRLEVLAEARADILAAAPGSIVVTIGADVSTVEGATRSVGEAVEALGGLDVVVNNAGTSAAGPFLAQEDETWIADLDLKLFGAIRVTRLALLHFRAAGGGRVVNVTAISGKHPGAGSGPTAVSRAAGLALTKLLSKEFARDNVLVNAVCIGLVRSEQIERGARARFPDLPIDDALQRMGEGVPIGRIGTAAEAGDVIAFLCSERASFVTGVAVNIDGGMSAVL